MSKCLLSASVTQMELDFSEMGALAQTWSDCGGFDFDQASSKFVLEWGGLAKCLTLQFLLVGLRVSLRSISIFNISLPYERMQRPLFA